MSRIALITGAGGFIGSHLAEMLVKNGADVYAAIHRDSRNIRHMGKKIKILRCDICNKTDVEKAVQKSQPDLVFHMGAQSFVMPSWKDPEQTYKTNIIGTYYLLESLKNHDAVISVAYSSAAYGLSYSDEIPIKESREFRPSSPYGVSKATTDMLGFLYWRTYGMKVLRLRFFNTVGPRKTGSAVAEWSQGVAEIEAGIRKNLGVGNLEPIIDLIDVRDSMRAMWLLTKKGKWGEAYNICTGKGRKMEEILEILTSMSRKKIKVVKDPAKFRPADDPIFVGANTKLRKLGWEPKIPIEKTIEDTLNYWRSAVKKSA